MFYRQTYGEKVGIHGGMTVLFSVALISLYLQGFVDYSQVDGDRCIYLSLNVAQNQ